MKETHLSRTKFRQMLPNGGNVKMLSKITLIIIFGKIMRNGKTFTKTKVFSNSINVGINVYDYGKKYLY